MRDIFYDEDWTLLLAHIIDCIPSFVEGNPQEKWMLKAARLAT